MEAFTTNFNLQAIMKTNDISPDVQRHMSKVYMVLTGCIATAAFGSILNLAYGIGNAASGLLGFCVLLFVLFTKGETPLRFGGLALFTFLKGMSLGPLLRSVIAIDPSIIVTAFLATTVIFAMFSLAALVAKRRSYMYLASTLSSIVLILFLMSILSLFGLRSDFMMNIQLGLGLLVFMGYVILDTQMMIEKASSGYKDCISDALQLFIDFVAIFVRLLIILSKMSEKKEKK
jgi:FtsH-binding integral membrane protein